MSKTRPYKEMMQILSHTYDVGDTVVEALELSHQAAIAQAVKDERERWIKVILHMSVGSVDERIKNIEESQIVTPELLNKVVRAIRKAAKGADDG